MRVWLNERIDEGIGMLEGGEEKFGINEVGIEKEWWVSVVVKGVLKC